MDIKEKVKWIEKNGKHILIQDLSDCKDANAKEILKRFEREVLKTDKEVFSTLTIITGTKFDPGLFAEMKRTAKSVRPVLEKRKRAMVGIDTATRRILFKGLNMFAGGNPSLAFDTIEEALDYLSS